MNLSAKRVSKRFLRKTGSANFFYAVQETDFDLPEKSLTLLTGRSGGGKTTLLQMLGGLLSPSEGNVLADGNDLYAMSDPDLSRFRNRHIALVPQGKAAVPSLTVLENILLPQRLYEKTVPEETVKEAERLVELFGISALKNSYPTELSGGELRRMSLIRALAGKPDILLADEPTGDLDNENTLLVMRALRLAADEGAAVLLVTHENVDAGFADRAFRMDGGELTTL